MNRNLKQILSLSAGFALAASVRAQTLDFSFTVANSLGNVNGSFSGVVYGLGDNSTGPATDVVITSFPNTLNSVVGTAPIDVFASPWSVEDNSFTVTGGQITAAGFDAYAGDGYIYLDIGSDDNAL